MRTDYLTRNEFSNMAFCRQTEYLESLPDTPEVTAYKKQAGIKDSSWLYRAKDDSFFGTPALARKARAALAVYGVSTWPGGGPFKSREFRFLYEATVKEMIRRGDLSPDFKIEGEEDVP